MLRACHSAGKNDGPGGWLGDRHTFAIEFAMLSYVVGTGFEELGTAEPYEYSLEFWAGHTIQQAPSVERRTCFESLVPTQYRAMARPHIGSRR